MSEMSREEKRQWVRENMPNCAAIATMFQDVFGDVKLVYACENGHEIGRKSPTSKDRGDSNTGEGQ